MQPGIYMAQPPSRAETVRFGEAAYCAWSLAGGHRRLSTGYLPRKLTWSAILGAQKAKIRPNQTKSDQIKPDLSGGIADSQWQIGKIQVNQNNFIDSAGASPYPRPVGRTST